MTLAPHLMVHSTLRSILPLLCAIGLLTHVNAHAKVQITLHEEVQVKQANVRIADIAQITSPDQPQLAAHIAQQSITYLSHQHRPIRISSQQLQQRLLRLYPALQGKLEIIGTSSEITWTEPTRIAEQLEYIEQIQQSALTFAQQELEKHYPQYAIVRLQVDPHDLSQAVNSLKLPMDTWPVQPIQLQVSPTGHALQIVMQIAVIDVKNSNPIATENPTHNRTFTKTIRIPIRGVFKAQAWQLKRALAAGEILTINDVSHQTIEFKYLPLALAELNHLHDTFNPQRMRRQQATGSILMKDDVQPLPAVARNQSIIGELKRSNLAIEKNLIAQNEGEIGQYIRALDPHNKTTYTARIIGAGRVEIQ